MSKNVLITGEAKSIDDFCSRLFEENSKNGISTVILDFYNNADYRDAYELSPAEFMPYLTESELESLISNAALKISAERAGEMDAFLSSFGEFAEKTGCSLLNLPSMFSLLKLSDEQGCCELHNFLEDDFQELPRIENTLKSILKGIGKPRYDLSTAFKEGRVFSVKNARLGRSVYHSELIVSVLNCIAEFADPEKTCIYINGMSDDWSKIAVDFLSGTGFKKVVRINDMFTMDSAGISALLYGIDKIVFFKHCNNESCGKIADFIGKEERYQIGINSYPDTAFSAFSRIFKRGLSVARNGSIVGSGDTNIGYSANLQDKYRIRPDEISSLGEDRFILYNTSDSSFRIEKVI